ncbi:MAG: phosphoribosylamine--glycine ligase [Prevotella sp.]|nr:phosphoribosylamine--glycine ligase [Alistipes senegalensis]MCM1357376.1 phosphoribosylamine--glycine ligase [Prevotella sp.]MCM1473744.1 phosphoribosylamine--glycine ligase [Muribaculaceae bacterium]
MKNILVVGGGGREHAIIMKLAESKHVDKLYCTPGNAGISKYAECFNVGATDIDGVVALAKEIKPDMVVVAPDDPLVMGMVDALQAEGFMTFGPKANAAIIEGSKVFSKELMKKYNIPTAFYEVFTESDKAIEYLKKQNTYPAVIKADGLALGKGVIIAQNEEEAIQAVHEMIDNLKFGKSSARIVIEEFLTGPEVSVLSFTDGKTIVPMISSMDHKRALDGDKGLNTGGMGTLSPNPYYTEEVAKECMEKIFIPTMNAMNAEGRTLEGCLYFGLMITPKGAKVIEYNCRFGDPETQVVLPMLDADLYEIFEAIYNHELDKVNIKWHDGSCACVVMASGGYPESYPKGIEMNGFDEKGQIEGCFVYHAGTKLSEDGKFLTNGGRVIGITAKGETLQKALDNAYDGVSRINFDGAHYRKDIGQRALKALE